MSYDEENAERVRRILSGERDVVEIRMFGGLCFLVNGNMCCGVGSGALMIRVATPLASGHWLSHTRDQ